MIANGNLEIEEQEDGTYVFPVTDPKDPKYSWALYMFKDGRGADLYTKRGPSGVLLGKPIHLPNPEEAERTFVELIHPYDLSEMLNDVTVKYVDVIKTSAPHDQILEISGKLYMQSTRVKARTKSVQ
jgi:hypothetical protein